MRLDPSIWLSDRIGVWADRSLDRVMERKQQMSGRPPVKLRHQDLLQSVCDGATADLDSGELASATLERLVEERDSKLQLTPLGEYVLGSSPVRRVTASPGGQLASSQGANVLLAMGVVLFLIACGALAVGHALLASLLAAFGLVTVLITVTITARLGRLTMLSLEVAKVKATFKAPADDGAHESDNSPDAEKQPSI